MGVLKNIKDAVEGEVKAVESDVASVKKATKRTDPVMPTVSSDTQVPPFNKTCGSKEEAAPNATCLRIKDHVLPHSDLNGHDWS